MVKSKSPFSNASGLQQMLLQDWRGLNQTSDRLNAPPDFLYDCLNGYVKKDVKTNRGIITQRDGTAKFNSVQLGSGYGTTKKIRVVFEAKWDGGSTDVIIRAGTAWGKFDGTNTFNTVLTSRADDAYGQAAMFKNELIMVDGGVPQKMTSGYTVSALSSDSNMPQDSDAVGVIQGKVWLNSQANPMMAYFCTTNSADGSSSWTGSTDAGTLDLSTVLPVGDRIRAFRPFGGQDTSLVAIICDKFTVIYAAGANAYTFNLLQILPTTCVAVNALSYLGTDMIYPSRDGMTSIFNNYDQNLLSIKPYSEYITNLWRNLIKDTGTLTDISGTFNHKLNHYYITFPISGNFQTLVYSADIGNFVGRWTFTFNPLSWCERGDGTILAGDDNGYVHTINTGTEDDSTAVNFQASLPGLYFGDPIRYKKPIEMECLCAGSATLTFNFTYWFGIAQLGGNSLTKQLSIGATASLWDVALWDSSYWDMAGNTFAYTSDILGRGKVMFINISNNTASAQMTIYWLRLGYQVEGTV